jgi:hypothetical protein
VPFPPSLRDPRSALPPTAQVLRHVASHPSLDERALPGLAPLADRATVYVTLGTVFNQESGDLFERIVEGVRDLPVNVVATVGRALDPEVLGPQPPKAMVSLVLTGPGAGLFQFQVRVVGIELGADRELAREGLLAQCRPDRGRDPIDVAMLGPG